MAKALRLKSKRIAGTRIAPVKSAPVKIAHAALQKANIAIAVVPAKQDKPLTNERLIF